MNQNNLYLTLIALPAVIMMTAFIIGLSVVVVTNNANLLDRMTKIFAVMLIIVGVYEIAMITYVAIIKLIN